MNFLPQACFLRELSPHDPTSGKPTWGKISRREEIFLALQLTTLAFCHAPGSEVCNSCFFHLGYWQHQAQRYTGQSSSWAHVPASMQVVKTTSPTDVFFSPNLVLHPRLWVDIGSTFQLEFQGLWGTRYEPVGCEMSFVICWKTGQIDHVSRSSKYLY